MISLSKHIKGSGSSMKDEVTISVVIFGVVGRLYTLLIFYKQIKGSVKKWNMLIAFGGLCYYIGDNLPPLIREYQNEFCENDQECVERVQYLGICMQLLPTYTAIDKMTNFDLV